MKQSRRGVLPPGASLLDLGCYGRTTVPFAQLGYRVFGIDIAPRMIAGAAREHPSTRSG